MSGGPNTPTCEEIFCIGANVAQARQARGIADKVVLNLDTSAWNKQDGLSVLSDAGPDSRPVAYADITC
jgi:hypothetical protein